MIEQLIPTQVSEIIRANRDQLVLSIEEAHVLEPLISESINGCLKGEICPAYFVQFTFFPNTAEEKKDIHILGEHKLTRLSYITSQIVAVSEDLSQVQTQSGSIYDISDVRVENPHISHVLHICHALHWWGMGRHFDVVKVFY